MSVATLEISKCFNFKQIQTDFEIKSDFEKFFLGKQRFDFSYYDMIRMLIRIYLTLDPSSATSAAHATTAKMC